MKSRVLLFSMVYLLLNGFVDAQESTSAPQDHFRTLVTRGTILQLYFSQVAPPVPPADPAAPSPTPDPDFKEIPLQAYSSMESGAYPFDRTKPLYIFEHSTDSKGNPLYPLVGKFDFTQGPQLPLLLFQPFKGGSYKIVVISDDVQSLPGGSIRFINLSNASVVAAANSNTVQVNPNQIQVLKFEKPANGVYLLSIKKTSDGSVQYRNMWGYDPTNRITAFIQDNPDVPGRLSMAHIVDGLTGF